MQLLGLNSDKSVINSIVKIGTDTFGKSLITKLYFKALRLNTKIALFYKLVFSSLNVDQSQLPRQANITANDISRDYRRPASRCLPAYGSRRATMRRV